MTSKYEMDSTQSLLVAPKSVLVLPHAEKGATEETLQVFSRIHEAIWLLQTELRPGHLLFIL